MGKWKQWLYTKFLPAWCREDLLEANARLCEGVAELRRENEQLRSYIAGMENAMRFQKRPMTQRGGDAR